MRKLKKLNFKAENNLDVGFSMSSMTDITFLLLIFFMITSSFDNLEGMDINLPKSVYSKKASDTINIGISSDKEFYVDGEKVDFHSILELLKGKYVTQSSLKVLIRADKLVPVDSVVQVANIVKSISDDATISIATKQ